MNIVSQPPFIDPLFLDQFENPSGTQYLLRRNSASLVYDSVWREKQDAFLNWTRDAAMFNEADVLQNTMLYKKFFEETRGLLMGCVLDIGGGWGLFRKWWDATGAYTVHDPGVERFTVSPPASLKRHFSDGLVRPAWFVEGFGEELPYQDCSYDVAMIASALDHCVDPPRVLAEAYRVLRLHGTLLLIQGFEDNPTHLGSVPKGRRFHERLMRLLADPRRLNRAIRMRLFHRGEPHMHHFSREELHAMVIGAGFGEVQETVISERFGVLALEACKRN